VGKTARPAPRAVRRHPPKKTGRFRINGKKQNSMRTRKKLKPNEAQALATTD
jgi:hypothetical protein